QRPFLAFWLARVCTASGFQMLTVAIGWHLYELTGSVLDLGLVGLVEFLPRVLFILFTGHVVDRYDRRKIAALCQSAQALIALARAVERRAPQALLPGLVPAALFPAALAASASAIQAATIVAPAVGGLLFAFGAFWVYVPTAVLYLLACALMLSLPNRHVP